MINKLKFAKLISMLTNLCERPLDDYEIERIDALTSEESGPFALPGAVNELLSCMLCGKKIDAIRQYRALTGAPLKDSKEAVEAFWTYTNPPKDTVA